jgi:exonuclease V gamma subunit
MKAAAGLRRPTVDVATTAAAPARRAVVELAAIEEMLHDPLKPFVRRTLDINTWRDDDGQPPATLPLAVSPFELGRLTDDLLDQIAARPDDDALVAVWAQAMQASGRLPFGGFGTAAREEIATLARAIAAKAAALGMPLAEGRSREVRLAVGRFQIVGQLERVYEAEGRILLVRTESLDGKRFRRPRLSAGLFLLAAIADGLAVREAHVVSRHEDWALGNEAAVTQARSIAADPPIEAAEARRRLETLCELLEVAAAAPCGSFGDAAAKAVVTPGSVATPGSDDARKAFAAFVNDPRDYGRSLERVAYGPHPAYERVFFPGSPELLFHERFAGLVTVEHMNGTRYALR